MRRPHENVFFVGDESCHGWYSSAPPTREDELMKMTSQNVKNYSNIHLFNENPVQKREKVPKNALSS